MTQEMTFLNSYGSLKKVPGIPSCSPGFADLHTQLLATLRGFVAQMGPHCPVRWSRRVFLSLALKNGLHHPSLTTSRHSINVDGSEN